jgi:hypothetical protein
MALKIRVRNPMADRQGIYAFPMPEYYDYIGDIVPNPPWVKDDHFCLSTGNADFSFRVIEKERIICGWQLPASKNKVPTYTVKSKGKMYLVTGGKCTCTGYSYRRHCSHVAAVESYKQRKVA